MYRKNKVQNLGRPTSKCSRNAVGEVVELTPAQKQALDILNSPEEYREMKNITPNNLSHQHVRNIYQLGGCKLKVTSSQGRGQSFVPRSPSLAG